MADVAQEAKEAYTQAVRVMALVAGGIMVIGLAASFGLPADPRRRRPEEQGEAARAG